MNETQMNDSRMNINSLLTASIDNYIPGMKGAVLANYTEMKSFTKNEETNKITGAVCFDKINKKEFTIRAKQVVNCCGVHADILRQLDDPTKDTRIVPSRGTHLIFKKGMLNKT